MESETSVETKLTAKLQPPHTHPHLSNLRNIHLLVLPSSQLLSPRRLTLRFHNRLNLRFQYIVPRRSVTSVFLLDTSMYSVFLLDAAMYFRFHELLTTSMYFCFHKSLLAVEYRSSEHTHPTLARSTPESDSKILSLSSGGRYMK